MKRLFLALTVAALLAMMVAAGPASADNFNSGSTSGFDNSPVFIQSNSSIDGDIGDDFFDDFGDSGFFAFFGDDDSDFGDLDSGGINISFGGGID